MTWASKLHHSKWIDTYRIDSFSFTLSIPTNSQDPELTEFPQTSFQKKWHSRYFSLTILNTSLRHICLWLNRPLELMIKVIILLRFLEVWIRSSSSSGSRVRTESFHDSEVSWSSIEFAVESSEYIWGDRRRVRISYTIILLEVNILFTYERDCPCAVNGILDNTVDDKNDIEKKIDKRIWISSVIIEKTWKRWFLEERILMTDYTWQMLMYSFIPVMTLEFEDPDDKSGESDSY